MTGKHLARIMRRAVSALFLAVLVALLSLPGAHLTLCAEESAAELEQKLAEQEKTLGPEHPEVAAILHSLASMYEKQAQYAKAEPLCDRALAIREMALGADHPDVAACLNLLGDLHVDRGRYDEAEPLYQRALTIRETALGPEHPEVAASLHSLASLYEKGAQYDKAEPLCDRALAIRGKALGADHPDVATSLNLLGDLHVDRGRYDEAEPLYQRALEIRKKRLGPDHPDVADTLNNLALLYDSQGHYSQAEPLYQRALAIREKALGPEHPDTAQSLNNLALLYDSQAQYDKAEPLYQRALAIREMVLGPEHPKVAISLNNLALLYESQAQYAKAEPLLKRALAICEKSLGPDHPDVADTLNNLAALYDSQAQYAKAEPLYKRAWAIKEKALGPDHPDVAISLNNLAGLYDSQAQYAKAEPLYKRALAIDEKAYGPDHPDVAIILDNLAELYKSQGQYSDAEPLYKRALAIREKALGSDHPDVATSLNNMAELYKSQGQYSEAEPLYLRALTLHEKAYGTEHPDVAISLNNLAGLYDSQAQYDKAEPLYQRALPIAEGSGEPELLWNVQGNLSVLYAESNPNLAIFYGKQAVNTLQSVRSANTGLDKEMQRSFLKSQESYYTYLADLLFARGRLAEGQQVMAMLKEAEYHEFIERSAGEDPRSTRAELTPEEAKQNTLYREMGDKLAALGKEYRALAVRDEAGLDEAEKARKAELREAINAANKQYRALLDELKRDFAALGGERKTEFDEKNIRNLAAMSGTLNELGHGAVLLTYLVAEERLWILLTTGDRVSLARQVPIRAAELNKKIAAFREAVTDRRTNAGELGKELHELLIAPVADALEQAGAKTLMLSLDGALRYLPFAALYDGEQYLVERYALAVYTEVAKDKLRAEPTPDWHFAGFGVTRAVGGHSPLAAVREELEGIRENALDGPEPLYDDAFNAESFRDALDQSPPVAHVSSHFVFSPGNEQNSYLLLGDGGKLTLADIREEDYPFDVDLVALSACETAVGGGRDENGREVEGFGVLVQQQGAKGVLATLWPVNDESTGQLMQLFYGYRQQGKLTKAEALRRAQLAFIEGRVETELVEVGRGRRTDASAATGGRPQPVRSSDPAHPYFWAPFILMGNWL